jgi:membrane-associated phospholipid phosphatase
MKHLFLKAFLLISFFFLHFIAFDILLNPSPLWVGAVGYSRLDLSVHYPSDVFMGAVIDTN